MGTRNVNWSTYKKATPYWSRHRRRTAERQTGIRESGQNTEGSTENLNNLKEKERKEEQKQELGYSTYILPTIGQNKIVCETVNCMQ